MRAHAGSRKRIRFSHSHEAVRVFLLLCLLGCVATVAAMGERPLMVYAREIPSARKASVTPARSILPATQPKPSAPPKRVEPQIVQNQSATLASTPSLIESNN